ncbi:hypothetical protein HZF05_17900 [Sphingomonas sp. CGMCC 1.13654]|uniref:Uncharacterized protein n=1 Tax=Sphingomonas chungangi TaxID=2683589 RepID=A0A838LAA3_9SPHN|nr:hypothetical protein [Sphingomonas chungangi]MBA2935957.1 hypothetical protein [Sphingomonas chungangi]MVW55347.1 hypothetical protein [Sphingomonas chungangi]
MTNAAVVSVIDRATMKTITGAAIGQCVILTEAARSGVFRWDPMVSIDWRSIDSQEGIFVFPSQSADGAWVRIYSGALDVTWFGAVGDCPDLSELSPSADQSAISAAVASATDDWNYIQVALRVAFKLGGGVVDVGREGRIHRVTLNLAQPALAVGANTTLRGIDGGRIELDPSQITNWKSNHWTVPAGTGVAMLYGTIGAGDPMTGCRPTPATPTGPNGSLVGVGAVDGQAAYPASSMTLDRMIGCVRFVGLDIRCHQRVNWRGWPATGPDAQDWRLAGITNYFTYDSEVVDCHVHGVPNTGINFFGGFNRKIENCRTSFCGFGAQLGGSCNGVQIAPAWIADNPEISSHDDRIINIISRYTKDSGVAFGYSRGIIIDEITSKGDHDQVIEGIFPSNVSVDNEISITNVSFDGQHDICLLAKTANVGDLTVTLNDAFMVQPNDTGTNDRYLFIKGAGSGGSDGPFAIVGTDLVNNVVTLGASIQAAIPAGTPCYTRARRVIGLGTGNRGRVNISAVRGHSIYGVFSLFDCIWKYDTSVDPNNHTTNPVTDKPSYASFTDIEVSDFYCASTTALISSTASHTVINGLRAFSVSGTDACYAVNLSGGLVSAVITGVDIDPGLTVFAQLGSTTGISTVRIYDNVVRGTHQSAIVLRATSSADHILIEDNVFINLNASGAYNSGVLQIYEPTSKISSLVVRRNKVTAVRAMGRPISFAQPASSYSNVGFLTSVTVEGNDWGGASAMGMFGSYGSGGGNYDPYIAASFDNSTNYAGSVIDRNNELAGQRQLRQSSSTIGGTYGKGDRIDYSDPLAGSAPGAICTISGTFGAIPGGTTVSATSGGAYQTLTLSSVAGLVPGSWINVGSSGLNPMLRRVVAVNGNVITMSEALNTGVLAGAIVTNQEPVLKSVGYLAS